MNSQMFFKMFSNCLVSRGKNRSLILDIQREKFTFIPDTLEEIIEVFSKKKSVGEIHDLYGIDNIEIINEYLNFLLENEFGFLVNFEEFDLFVEMSKDFETPSFLSNCIIEISNKSLINFEKSINSLEKISCKNIQLISYDEIEITVLKKILKITQNTNFQSIELVLKYTDTIFNFIPNINQYNYRITQLTLHSSGKKSKKLNTNIFTTIYIDYEIKNFSNCGIIDSKYFNVNQDKVFESYNHNSCLHKKISIDKNGDIKNCPSMVESFGNIEDKTLEEALNHPNFKKYWNINKDQIEVCKDCEFRHICTDCRAYIEEPKNQYSKPLKCGYSPYTNEWEEWSTNPLKQKAIEFYGMQDLVKKDV